jgi:hypothetical protein
MKKSIGSGLIIFCALQFLLVPEAFAATVFASASYWLPPPQGSTTPINYGEFNSSDDPGATVSAQANTTVLYRPPNVPLGTAVSALALSSASASDITAGASLVVEDFDQDFPDGEGFFVDARAKLDDTYTTSSLVEIFGSPIFHLSGDLLSDSSVITSNVHFFSTQLGGTLFRQFSAPEVISIDEMVIPEAVAMSTPTFFSFDLFTTVESPSTDTFLPGDYTTYADFSSTVSLLGFALFEDQAMTMPVLDGVTVTNSAGETVPLINLSSPNPVPLPAAVWLFGTALIGFIGYSRRRTV